MQIVLDPGSYDFKNLGCVAVRQVAVRRLRELWPHARILVLTADPVGLARHCPDARPLLLSGHRSLLCDNLLGHRRWLPAGLQRAVGRMDGAMRERWPDMREKAVRIKLRLQRRSTCELEAFSEAMERADLVVTSGLAGVRGTELHVLETLDLAIQRRKPTAMFSLGLGGPHNAEQERKIARVLPRVNLIALRERRTSPRVLRRLGIESLEFVVTGDDAVGLAYEARVSELGTAIGVNLRFGSSELNEAVVTDVRAVLAAILSEYGARPVPLPTAEVARPDKQVIERVLAGLPAPTRMPSLDTPLAIVQAISQCRVVVTAAYHAAVFALAQGVPTVCIAKSDYFTDKLTSLADLFGRGCLVVSANDPHFCELLRHAIQELWVSAELIRPKLLAAAQEQSEASRAAYGRLVGLFAPEPQAEPACDAMMARTEGRRAQH